jgi:tripartite-type tricarboxylate transporter receptor subunit TctC
LDPIITSSGRRRFIQATGAGLAVASTGLAASARAAGFPEHSIRLIVAYAPGGSTDIVARMFAQDMTVDLGQSVVLENRPGGGTIVGTQTVERAPADGYTLLYGTNAFVITPMLHDQKTYDPLKDFAPVSLTAVQPLGILVSPELHIKTVQELIAYARANPGKLNFASSGNGSAQHLAGEAFAKAAGIQMLHVPYKGAGPALTDLLGGRVHLMFTSLVGNMQHVKEGRLVLIATTGLKRSPATPDVPTVDESGVKGFVTESWQGVLAPAGTPAAVIDRLNASIVKAGKSQKLIDQLSAQGMEVRTDSPSEFAERLQQEQSQYKALIEQNHIKVD